jgi:hypothetical protein
MASSGKKKTTMAKLTRESRLRQRRLDKQAKKDARRQAPADAPEESGEPASATSGESASTDSEQPALETLQARADA